MIDGATPERQWTEKEIAALKLEQYKDVFKVPGSFDEAWNHPCSFQQKKWRDGFRKEVAKMDQHKVWKLVKRSSMPKGRRPIKSKWVLEIKRDGTFRCRLVGCGYSQIGGIDFEEIYNAVANDVTFRILLTAKMVLKKECGVFDIETAFLNADTDKELYMEVPQGVEAGEDEVARLLKAIYGTVQAARAFGQLFAKIMRKIGFKQSSADPCLFIRKDENGTVFVIIYIDDGFFVGDRPAIDSMVTQLEGEGLKLKVKHNMEDYLSCQVKFNKDGRRAWLGQPHMIKKIESSFGEEARSARLGKTPGTPGQILNRPQKGEEALPADKQRRLRSGVGMLLYLVKHSRPDIANAVRELTKCMDLGTPVAYKELLKVVKFVLHTKDLGLKMYPNINFEAL